MQVAGVLFLPYFLVRAPFADKTTFFFFSLNFLINNTLKSGRQVSYVTGVVVLRGCSQTVCGLLLVLELELLKARKQVRAVCVFESRELPLLDFEI